MPILSQAGFGPRTALAYVTGGVLLCVWTLVWYFTHDEALVRSEQFWVVGLGMTGMTFFVLGLLLGRIGRSARQAELPPPAATRAETEIQKIAAANPAPVVAGTPAAPAAAATPIAPAVVSNPTEPVGAGMLRHDLADVS